MKSHFETRHPLQYAEYVEKATPRLPFPKMRKPSRNSSTAPTSGTGTQIQVLHNNTMANPIMSKPLATLINETFINWTPYLYPLMFNYNTSFWRTTSHPTSVHTLETQLQSEAHPIQAKLIYRSTRPLHDNTRTNTV
jgi:hypothetical protein